MRPRHLLVSLLLLAVPLHAQGPRRVEGNRILSDRLPAATLTVASGLTYAGTQSFDLHGVAHAEQHFFVELDGTRVKRLLWIQFEGFHATNDNRYDYSFDSTVTHSGRTWHRGIATWRTTRPSRPGSDGARTLEFLAAKGWTLGSDLFRERLVWLLDRPARNELMVIYLEDLADHGLTAADLAEGGAAHARLDQLRAGLHQRAVASFRVE